MLNQRRVAVLCACAAFCLLAAAEDKPDAEKKPDAPPAAATPSKYGARDVEVRLQDGSQLRGTIIGAETIVLKTDYGILTFPVTDILRIDRGERMSAQETQDLAGAIKDLDSEEFAKRSAAQYKLEGLSAAAVESLRAARDTASPESKNRIDAVLKKISAKNPRKIQTQDTVRCARFEAAGTLQLETLGLRSRFGDLNVKLEDLQTVRWLKHGETHTLDLEPNTAITDWVDTGVEGVPGDKLVVIASGSINLFNSQAVTPVGTSNWGNNGPFLIGAVVGKMGLSGEPFLIGKGKSWHVDSAERLYLKIYCNEEMTGRITERSRGQFNIKIASGAYADELESSIPAQ